MNCYLTVAWGGPGCVSLSSNLGKAMIGSEGGCSCENKPGTSDLLKLSAGRD
jgi:hypothetical protein